MAYFCEIRPNLVKSLFIPHLPDCRNIPTFLNLRPIEFNLISTHSFPIVGMFLYCHDGKLSGNELTNQIVEIFLHFNSCPIISLKGENDRTK